MMIDEPNIEIRMIHPNSKTPLVNNESGRITLYTCAQVGGNVIWLPGNGYTRIHTGIELTVPSGYVGIMSTSQSRLDNLMISLFPACSILDSSVTGEIIINVANFSDNVVCIKDGEPLVDIIIQKAIIPRTIKITNTVTDRVNNIPS